MATLQGDCPSVSPTRELATVVYRVIHVGVSGAVTNLTGTMYSTAIAHLTPPTFHPQEESTVEYVLKCCKSRDLKLGGSTVNCTLLHYGSLPFTSVVGSESRPSSRGVFVT